MVRQMTGSALVILSSVLVVTYHLSCYIKKWEKSRHYIIIKIIIRIKIPTQQTLSTLLLLYYLKHVMVLCGVSLEDVPGQPASGHADTLPPTCRAVLGPAESVNVTCRWHVTEFSLNICTCAWSAHMWTCCEMCFNEEQVVWFCSNKRYPGKRVATCLPILQCSF